MDEPRSPKRKASSGPGDQTGHVTKIKRGENFPSPDSSRDTSFIEPHAESHRKSADSAEKRVEETVENLVEEMLSLRVSVPSRTSSLPGPSQLDAGNTPAHDGQVSRGPENTVLKGKQSNEDTVLDSDSAGSVSNNPPTPTDPSGPTPVINDDIQQSALTAFDPESTAPSGNLIVLSTLSPGNPSPHTALADRDFIKALKFINFRTLKGLQLLCRIDSGHNSRDISLFCDHKRFNTIDIDYTIRCGPTASYIKDRVHCEKPALRGEIRLKDGISGLRVLKLSYNLALRHRTPRDKERSLRKLEEWKMKIRAPQYVYELGPLLLHRQFEASKGRRSIHNIAWTRFNVVIDILSPTKSLWLIMRPEFSPRAYSHPLTGQENIDSKIPFANDDPSCDLYSYSSARLMKSIDDLRPYLSFDQSSYPAFRQGLEEVFGSTFGEDGIQIQFTVPDHDEIMREIVGEV